MKNFTLHMQRIMRISLVLYILFFSCSQLLMAEANGQALRKPASLVIGHQTTLEQAIQRLSQTAKVDFAYDARHLGVAGLTAHPAAYRDRPLEKILTAILAGTDILFKEEIEGTITLYKPQQPGRIHGRVTDDRGEPLAGATLTVNTLNRSYTTDSEGAFTFSAQPGVYDVEVTYVSYTTQRKQVSIQSGQSVELSFTLQAAEGALSEVVVVGYGTQKKINVTGSVAVVNGDDLNNRPITNASQALQGVPGIYVNQAGGQPGADGATIRIRGVGTIGGGGKLNPLVLVDGVEYPLSAVNPADIESISVLKDAASSAIYGSRAANGVVLITTKLGKRDQTTIEYSNYFGAQEATYLPDAVESSVDFMEWYNKAMVNQGGNPYYSEELINEFRTNPTSLVYPNTNWMDLMFGTAPIQEHNIRFAGGTEKTRYNLSAGYLGQDGVLKGMTGADRYSLNLKINSELSKRVSIEGGVMASRWDKDEPKAGISTVMNRIMRMVPIQPAGRMEDGRWPDSWVLTPGQNSFENPLIWAAENYQKQVTDRMLINLALNYRIIDGLLFNIRASANEGRYDMRDWNTPTMLYNVKTGAPTRYSSASVATLVDYGSKEQRLNTTSTLNYEKTFGSSHNLSVLGGFSVETFKGSWRQASVQGFPTTELPELNIGTANQATTGTSYEDALLSYFGRLQYNFRNRYLFEFNSRYDGSSRFAEGNRWGFFPSLSLGWRLSEESFLQDATWLDDLKLRGSWGQIGNQEIGRFQYVNSVSLGLGYPFGGTYAPGSAVTQSKDPTLSWETTTMSNLGLDWSLFNGKLTGEFDVFRKRTDGILRAVTLPAQVGALGGPVQNLAVVDNSGFEVSLSHTNRVGDFTYQLGAHLTKIRNEVVELMGEEVISGSRITRAGDPIESWYLLKTDGLFQTEEEVANYPTITSRVGPGDVKYVDLNEDGKIDGNDRYIAGSTFPDFTYGFNLSGGYKGFSLSTVWQGVSDVSVRLNGNMAMPFNNGAGLTKNWITDSWTPENPNALLPRITTRHQYTAENFSDSDFWLYDASYLRLKNIQLAYTFQNAALRKIGIDRLQLFVNGQNMLTFSKMKLFDPEQDLTGEHIGKYPSVKIYTAGLTVNF